MAAAVTTPERADKPRLDITELGIRISQIIGTLLGLVANLEPIFLSR
jgi:hypothetical protein